MLKYYKMIMNEIKELHQWRNFPYRKTQYRKQSRFPSLIYRVSVLAISFSKLFCEYKQTDFKVYMKRQITQNSQHNTEE